MAPDDMAERLDAVASVLDEIAAELDASVGEPCRCCGNREWANPVEFRAKEALDAAATRVRRVLEKLRSGEWKDRQLAGLDAVPAEAVRRGS